MPKKPNKKINFFISNDLEMFRKAVETGLKENTPPEGGKRNNTEVHLTVERVLRDSSRKGVEALRIGVTEETLEKIIEASIENREQGN